MFGQVTPRSFVCLVSIWVVLTIGIIGCGGDDDDNDGGDNEWVGTWAFATIDGIDFEEFFAALGSPILTNKFTFHDDGTWNSEMAIEGLPAIKGMGTYSLSGSNYTISGFNFSNTVTDSGLGPAEDAGTWSREGNTLTVTSSDGTVVVLKKK